MSQDEESKKPVELGFEEIADKLVPLNPKISPDGNTVVFTVTSASRKTESPESAIWLSRNGEPAKRFSGGEFHDRDVSWSPDGTRLAFLSNRKDHKKTAIYLLPVDGGEAQRLGELDGELSNLVWAPDGKSLAVLRVDPETDAEKKRKEDKDDPEVFEEELKFSRLWTVDVETGKARCVTYAARNVWEYAWTLESDGLVYITTPLNTINSLFTTATLWHVNARGGLSRQIAEFSPAPGSPVVREVNGKQVVALCASARQRRSLPANLDRTDRRRHPNEPDPRPQGRRVHAGRRSTVEGRPVRSDRRWHTRPGLRALGRRRQAHAGRSPRPRCRRIDYGRPLRLERRPEHRLLMVTIRRTP